MVGSGIPKTRVLLNSVYVDILRLIAESIDPDYYKEHLAKKRKPTLLAHLEKDDCDTVDFGSIILSDGDLKLAYLVPTSKPYKYDTNIGEVRYTLPDLIDDASSTEEEDLDKEFWAINREQFEGEDFGTSSDIAKTMIIKVLKNPKSYPRLCISLNKIPSTKSKAVNFDTSIEERLSLKKGLKDQKRNFQSTPAINSTRYFIQGIPAPPFPPGYDNEDFDDEELDEALRRSKNDIKKKQNSSNNTSKGTPSKQSFNNSMGSLSEKIEVKDQAKIKVSLRMIGFEDLKTLRTWITDSLFALELAGITEVRLRVSQLLAHMRDSLKHQVIRKLTRLQTQPDVDDVHDALLECDGNTSLDAKRSIEKFTLNLHRPIIEQFHALESIIERAWPGKTEEAIHELTEIKLIEKLPRSVSEESLFKYRSEDLSTDQLMELIQKILDCLKDTKSLNFLDKQKITCYYCKKQGHKKAECRMRLNVQAGQGKNERKTDEGKPFRNFQSDKKYQGEFPATTPPPKRVK